MPDYYTPPDDYGSLTPAQRSERQAKCHRAFKACAQSYGNAPSVCHQCGKQFVVAAPDNPNVCFNCGDTEFTENKNNNNQTKS